MTLIVKNQGFVAIDRCMTDGEDGYSDASKVLLRGTNHVITGIGNSRSWQRLCDWIVDGCNEDEWPFSKDYRYGFAACHVWYVDRVDIYETDSPFPETILYDDMPNGIYTDGTAKEFAKGWLWRNTESLHETGFRAASNERLLEKLFHIVSENYGHVGAEIDIFDTDELSTELEKTEK